MDRYHENLFAELTEPSTLGRSSAACGVTLTRKPAPRVGQRSSLACFAVLHKSRSEVQLRAEIFARCACEDHLGPDGSLTDSCTRQRVYQGGGANSEAWPRELKQGRRHVPPHPRQCDKAVPSQKDMPGNAERQGLFDCSGGCSLLCRFVAAIHSRAVHL